MELVIYLNEHNHHLHAVIVSCMTVFSESKKATVLAISSGVVILFRGILDWI